MSRTTAFFNWRTLPGHSEAARVSIASSLKRLGGTPKRFGARSAKCATSIGMSSLRSRSGGTRMVTMFRRCSRSSRKLPLSISSCRSLLLAEMTRTSTEIGRLSPTRVKSPPCSARRTLAWVAIDMSPISSRKSVPRWACSNFPVRSDTAPVNDPLTCPKSSDSISSEGIAAQLTSTKGRPARVERRWRARAVSSLPVPFSPAISTRASVIATVSISFSTFWIAGAAPTMSWRIWTSF